jgi:hypothetical protein
MKMLRPILYLITLVAVVPLVRGQAPGSGTPAPAKPAKPAPAAPPQAPTLVIVSEDDPDFAAGAAPDASQAGSVGLTGSAGIPPGLVDRIRVTPHAQREAMSADIRSRIDSTQQALVSLRDRVEAPGQRNANASVFQRAFAHAKTCEQALRKSLQIARETKTATNWASAQTALIRDYGEYAKAVAAVEAAGPQPDVLVR